MGSFAAEGTGIFTSNTMGMLQDPHQSGVTGANIFRNIFGVPAAIVDFVLRLFFGSRYITPMTWFFAHGLNMIAGGFTLFWAILRHGTFSLPVIFTGACIFVYLALSLYHGCRVWHKMRHMDQELDSEVPGPVLPFFNHLPRANDYLMLRCVWEPLVFITAVVILAIVQIVHPILMLYLIFCGVCAGIKGFLTWFIAFNYWRDLLDNRNRAGQFDNVITKGQTKPVLNTPTLAQPASHIRLPRESQLLLPEFGK